ncbi:hypothetical protein SP41_96 [Salmonella phage 41]|nr:hypothetical protein SP41_96 [Salmonella phage 41]
MDIILHWVQEWFRPHLSIAFIISIDTITKSFRLMWVD